MDATPSTPRVIDPAGDTPPGVWVTYYSDRSAACVFGSEIEALRHATAYMCYVHFVPFGCDVFTKDPA